MHAELRKPFSWRGSALLRALALSLREFGLNNRNFRVQALQLGLGQGHLPGDTFHFAQQPVYKMNEQRGGEFLIVLHEDGHSRLIAVMEPLDETRKSKSYRILL